MTKEELKNEMEETLEKGKTLLAMDKELAPVILLKTKNETGIIPAGDLMNSKKSKQLLVELVRSLTHKLNIDTVIFVSEVWSAIWDKDTPCTVAPSSIPERREAIMVLGETKNNGKVERGIFHQYFHKKGAGSPEEEIVFGEKTELDGSADNYQSMFNFLEEEEEGKEINN